MNKKLAIVIAAAGVAVSGALATLLFAEDADETSPTASDGARQITIWRDPGCGCCDAYAEYLEDNGYTVTRIDDREFDKRSIEVGVPAQGLGCHLAEIEGYYVSGLVPVDILDRMLTEQPEITGITLPGMPGNAPGMARDKYGTLRTYAFGPEGISIYSDE